MAIPFFKQKTDDAQVENRAIIDLHEVNKYYKTAIGDEISIFTNYLLLL